ncbi:MAG: hypothetical protein M1838_004082 [Thelocarpon superellum]|nr:MAG: hypothetical protein M1838_004082 [Thelocarpon superellum]
MLKRKGDVQGSREKSFTGDGSTPGSGTMEPSTKATAAQLANRKIRAIKGMKRTGSPSKASFTSSLSSQRSPEKQQFNPTPDAAFANGGPKPFAFGTFNGDTTANQENMGQPSAASLFSPAASTDPNAAKPPSGTFAFSVPDSVSNPFSPSSANKQNVPDAGFKGHIFNVPASGIPHGFYNDSDTSMNTVSPFHASITQSASPALPVWPQPGNASPPKTNGTDLFRGFNGFEAPAKAPQPPPSPPKPSSPVEAHANPFAVLKMPLSTTEAPQRASAPSPAVTTPAPIFGAPSAFTAPITSSTSPSVSATVTSVDAPPASASVAAPLFAAPAAPPAAPVAPPVAPAAAAPIAPLAPGPAAFSPAPPTREVAPTFPPSMVKEDVSQFLPPTPAPVHFTESQKSQYDMLYGLISLNEGVKEVMSHAPAAHDLGPVLEFYTRKRAEILKIGAKRKADAPVEEERAPKKVMQSRTLSKVADHKRKAEDDSIVGTPNKRSATSSVFENILNKAEQEKTGPAPANIFGHLGDTSPDSDPTSITPSANPSLASRITFANPQRPTDEANDAASTPVASDAISATPATNKGLFGASSTPLPNKANVFAGSTPGASFGTSSKNLFGANSNAGSTPAATPAAGKSKLFGTTAAGTTPSATPAAGNSLFSRITKPEATPAATTPALDIKNLFGQNPATPATSTTPATTATSSVLFGASSDSLAATPGLFGASSILPAPSPGLFGASSNTPAAKSALFGASTISSTTTPPAGLFGAPSTTTPAPTSNLFGAKSNLFGTSTNGTTPSSNISGPAVFATTPSTKLGGAPATPKGNLGQEADASDDEANGEEKEKAAQVDLTSSGAGEEDEDVVYQIRAKAMLFKPDLKAWSNQGVGPLRVLKHHETEQVRILMRHDPRGSIILNTAVMKHGKYELKGQGSVQMAVAGDDGQLKTWIIKVKEHEIAVKLSEILQKAAKAL